MAAVFRGEVFEGFLNHALVVPLKDFTVDTPTKELAALFILLAFASLK